MWYAKTMFLFIGQINEFSIKRLNRENKKCNSLNINC